MTEQTTAVETAPQASIVATEGSNLELCASCPEEMVQCHRSAIAWCENKIKLVQNECDELKAAFNKAHQMKWASGALKKHWALAEKRVVFYSKMLAAFKAGYYIIPNFPVTLFAIKTTKPEPKRMWARLRWEGQQNFQQSAEILPKGEGEYQNPNPVISKDWGSLVSDATGKASDTWAFQATDWAEMEFPANMARLHVMDAATRAMDLKVFDEVGFLPQDHKRNPDPVLIGRILDPKPIPYGQRRAVSFMIAWHIDTKTL